MEEPDIAPEQMKRLRNLKMFRDRAFVSGKSVDDEIIEFYRNRDPKLLKPKKEAKPKVEKPVVTLTKEEEYEKTFTGKLKALQKEYGVDMNNSNDVEQLKQLVRMIIQQETVNTQITKLQQSEEVDTRTLKNLGDYQRSLTSSVTEIQDKLGIARKIRQEKEVDEVSVFILDLKKRAKSFFDRKTVQVRCGNDEVELARYWLNFPKNTKKIIIEIKCPKCETTHIHTVGE